MEILEYNRIRAIQYARRWAFSRNPLFFDFTGGGGNCTNFVSQCLLAGTSQMNYTTDFGWYYISPDDRAAAWTGVEFFRNFIVNNAIPDSVGDGAGPFGFEVGRNDVELGDVVQLGREDGDYYHTLIVSGFSRRRILVAAHSDNAFNRPLYTYNYSRIRFIHIEGYRTDSSCPGACFAGLFTGQSLDYVSGNSCPPGFSE